MTILLDPRLMNDVTYKRWLFEGLMYGLETGKFEFYRRMTKDDRFPASWNREVRGFKDVNFEMYSKIIREGNDEIQLKIIESGIEVLKIADEDGWTVAHELAWKGSEKVQLKLLEYGEEVLWFVDEDGWTVAHGLVEEGSEKIRSKLRELGYIKRRKEV